MQKVLITGACGFIFSDFIRKAIREKQPYRFISLDRINNSSSLNGLYINKNHDFHIGDVADNHCTNVLFEFLRPDIVIHGAADTSTGRLASTNVIGTQVIADACLKWGVKKLVHISDDKVYGQLKRDEEVWTEDSDVDPHSLYATSKSDAELAVQHIVGRGRGLHCNIVRISNCYGPKQTSSKLIPATIKAILTGEKIPIYGQGLQARDWTYIADACSGILTVLNDGKPGETYNLTSGQEYTNLEVVQTICNQMGKGHDLMTVVNDKEGRDLRRASSASKLKTLGWQPSWKFKDGIAETVKFYQYNQWALKQ